MEIAVEIATRYARRPLGMFGIVTDKYLTKAHEAFNELNFHPMSSKDMDEDAFIKAAVKTLNHTKDLADAQDCVRMIQFCLKDFDKIAKAIDKHAEEWASMPFEGNDLLSIVDDDEAAGTYFVTNGIEKNGKEIYLSSIAFGDEEMYVFERKGNKYTLGDDSPYYIKPSAMTSTKMKLYGKDDGKLANIVLSKDMNVFLENNKTGVDIVINDGEMDIYSQEYLGSIPEDGYIEGKNMFACIEWDILDKDSKVGVAKITNFSDSIDIDLILIIAASTFLLFKRYLDAQTATNIAIMSSWARR